MSLCCFSQEQQQQRQSALLATGDRALLVRGPLASSGFCLASCWQAVPLFFAWCWDGWRWPGRQEQAAGRKGAPRRFESVCLIFAFGSLCRYRRSCTAGRRLGGGPHGG